MTHRTTLEFAAKTDKGLVRAHNEDAIAFNPEYGLAVLADGMGGYNAGEVASGIATSAFKNHAEFELQEINRRRAIPTSKALQRILVNAVEFANTAIRDAAFAQPEFSGMGTTLVAALFQQNHVLFAHIGDSRAYRFRDGELSQLTRDHSQLQEQIDAGLVHPEWARFAPNKNLITRALGVGSQVEVETTVHIVQPGDLYLLCSDGLSDMLSATQITALLGDGQEIEALSARLVSAANDNGGRDNISVVLAKVASVETAVLPRLKDRLLTWLK